MTMNKTLCIILICFLFFKGHASAQTSQAIQPLSLSASKSATKIKISGMASGYAAGLKINNAIVVVDTTIKVSPKTAYLSIDFSGIEGSSLTEILSGNNSFWIIDKNGKEIKSVEKFLKKVNGSLESEIVYYTVKIPFKLKTDFKNTYTVRYLWESKDRKKMIDIIASR